MISDFDRPHRISISGIYEFPFGRKGRVLKNASGALKAFVGGWQISGVYTFQSGAPLGNRGDLIFIGDINRLKRTGKEQTPAQWFNALKIDDRRNPGYGVPGFISNSAQQLVSNIRYFPLRFGFLRADQTNNLDLSMQKKVRIAESKQVVFRMDWLNAFNHPLFPQPNLTPTSPVFGVIQASTQANYPRRIEFGFRFLY